jgi:predicted 3-demethylubiquinone-9 3-methyltransferase (glyoxalase superfamily)
MCHHVGIVCISPYAFGMQKITPHLWFNTNAEEAVQFYTKVFAGGKIYATTHYPDAGKEVHGMEAGTVLTMEFEIEGYRFIALNGGPIFTFTPAISFTVHCETEEKINALWEKLAEDGMPLMPLDAYPFSKRYGWIQDRYGLSWQLIVPEVMPDKVIMPSLMFTGAVAGKAEEAMQLYTSVFKNASIGEIHRYGPGQEHDAEGTIMHADFMLEGQKFSVMDSAYPHGFAFNEAVSLLVTCEDQEELDYYWEKLSAVPEAEQCGWLKDAYGVSWQIAPKGMEEMLNNPDKEKANKAMEAMLKMKKIDIAELKRASES